MTNINIRSETLVNPVIVDGIGRAGKFFLGKISHFIAYYRFNGSLFYGFSHKFMPIHFLKMICLQQRL